MQISKLRLSGFKSFVEPTDLIISEGMTGVVGPNGCGKSNLLEAIRWVMGENRPTAMRGEGMEDVIFAGAATRPARNFAEVVVHVDNSERLAPAGFNDSDHLEIVRRITRDLGSAYRINGREVRARDVQMLFADASTGAHSPALVRQGQITELINARPTARRRILEEAAGISGLYQRRHEAELKLRGAETNLTRVDDVIEQLAVQLAQLQRQAKQAERYRQIAEELRRAEGLLLWRRWSEADLACSQAEEDLRERILRVARAEAAARETESARNAADEALPALREEEMIAAAVLQRLTVERENLRAQESVARERIEMLERRIEQISHDIEREAELNRDALETIARLEQEAAELARSAEGHDERLAAARDLAQNAADQLHGLEAELGRMTEELAGLAARHQSAQRLFEDSRKTLARSEAETERVRAEQVAAQAALVSVEATLEKARTLEARAFAQAHAAETALAAAETARSEAQAREAEARAARSEAEGEQNALRAEVMALSRLLERDTAEGGQILDRIQVQSGFEKALGAALADDLRAPEVASGGPSGWTILPAYSEVQPLPEGVSALGDHVRVPDVMRRRMSQIGLVDPDDGTELQPLLKPGQRLVSLEGDLWRWDGYRAWAEDAPSAAALRLEQINRLEGLKQQLEHASARAEGAMRAHEVLRATLARRNDEDHAARDARRAADTAVNEANRALSRAEADFNLTGSRLEALQLAVTRYEEEAEVARARLTEAGYGLAGLGDLSALRAALEEKRQIVEAARGAMMVNRAAADELRREGERRIARRQELALEIGGWTQRLETAGNRADELRVRKSAAEAELSEVTGLPETLAVRHVQLGEEIARAEARRLAASDSLAGAENVARQRAQQERDAERLAAEAREARARGEERRDGAHEARALAAERIAEDLEVSPGVLFEKLGIDPGAIPAPEVLEADVNRLKRQREALGAVNLRAEEDARGVETELEDLTREKTDLEEAIRTLRSAVASLNREGRERLLTAFEQVNSNFTLLFRHLFGGGEANLVLVESDDPLEAGLEIMCQPPGKKLSTLSLLSGGEQTLTALALIFAVFLANPAPICVLDEVDAPLDDANVTRFCDLLDEMCRRTGTRFLVITHHAVTMSRMDRLFGVTMAEQGVSQLVSVDLRRAEQMVA